MTNINIQLTFTDYEFRRVKTMGNRVVIYIDKSWVGKEVMIIPVPMNITDRLIDSTYDEKTGKHHFCLESNQILVKTVKSSGNIGRVYVPKELLGLDCLIIESPQIDNF